MTQMLNWRALTWSRTRFAQALYSRRVFAAATRGDATRTRLKRDVVGETELSVTKGESILVPIADLAEGADGWVYATAVDGGREGYLPHTYVRPVGGSLASVAEEDPSENYDDDSVEAEEVSD